MIVSITYFIYVSFFAAFAGILTGFLSSLRQHDTYSACIASPKLPNAQAKPQKNLPNIIVYTQSIRRTATNDVTLKELLKLADVSKIDYDNKSREISFEDAGMEIDLGGIAKGYTSSRIMDIFKEYDVDSGLVNLGGNVQTYRTKTDGSKWRVAVQSPEDESQYIGVVDVSDKAVITSGGYERYFEQDGKIYHHIIDPATGYPAESGLKSVTIVSDDGTLADGLSTSLFIMGKDKACEFWKAHSDEFDFVLLTDDDSMYISEGIADDYSSDYEYEVINAK